jgi:YtoQ family protein
MALNVYLSGEIHSQWREEIRQGAVAHDLPIIFTSPVTDHQASDAAGDPLGEETKAYWRDHQSARVNGLRSKNLIEKSDLVVVRFGEKYKQWNAAFDAGYCAALGLPYITLHDEGIVHALKEVDASAIAWAKTSAQVVEVLKYIARD